MSLFVDHNRGATISECGRYRYNLWRRLSGDPRRVLWILINPSVADAVDDDPTLRRLVGYSREWGFGRLEVVNLYAGIETKPVDLWKMADPVGPENDRRIVDAASAADLVVCGWGANAKANRIADVVGLLRGVRLHALRTTQAGQPWHPLYLRADLVPAPWEMP